MSTYAVVDNNGLIVNMAEWDGLSEWHPGEGLTAIESEDTWMIGGSIKGGKYLAPKVLPPSDDEIKAANNQLKSSLMYIASGKIDILQDAVDLDMATEEEAAALILWKKYRVLLNRIDADTSADISWPVKPE